MNLYNDISKLFKKLYHMPGALDYPEIHDLASELYYSENGLKAFENATPAEQQAFLTRLQDIYNKVKPFQPFETQHIQKTIINYENPTGYEIDTSDPQKIQTLTPKSSLEISPKQTTLEEEGAKLLEQSTPKRQRGRPRKNKVEETPVVDETPVVKENPTAVENPIVEKIVEQPVVKETPNITPPLVQNTPIATKPTLEDLYTKIKGLDAYKNNSAYKQQVDALKHYYNRGSSIENYINSNAGNDLLDDDQVYQQLEAMLDPTYDPSKANFNQTLLKNLDTDTYTNDIRGRIHKIQQANNADVMKKLNEAQFDKTTNTLLNKSREDTTSFIKGLEDEIALANKTGSADDIVRGSVQSTSAAGGNNPSTGKIGQFFDNVFKGKTIWGDKAAKITPWANTISRY